MAYRQFTDHEGNEWTVYDVVPRLDERRIHERRDGAPAAVEEDRRGDDRRAAVMTSRPVRLTRGWLCFECEKERRRLQPIPTQWQLKNDAELVELLKQARVAPRRTALGERTGATES